MDVHPRPVLRFVGLLLCATMLASLVAEAAPLENLAAKAKASANSEHNEHYLAKFAIDGKVPHAGSSAADLDAAWCVLKARSGDKADFTLAWQQPVQLAELIYWGRTTWFMNECWKDYEVYLDSAKEPAVRGTFQMIHGPQRIKIPTNRVSKVTIKFLNSYGGYNPGALEIQAFARSPSEKELARITAQATSTLAIMPWVEKNDPKHIREIILTLKRFHGDRYTESADHLARLEKLEVAATSLSLRERAGVRGAPSTSTTAESTDD